MKRKNKCCNNNLSYKFSRIFDQIREGSLREQGQALVEFALVIPLLLLLLLGIIELGRMIFTYSMIIGAAREGARFGVATSEESFGFPKYKDCDGIMSAVKRIGYFAGVDDDNITINYIDDTGIFSPTCPPSTPVHLGDSIVVSAETVFSSVVPWIPAIPLSSSSTRMIVKEIEVGESKTGAGAPTGEATDINFTAISQTAEESVGVLTVVVELNEPQTDLVTVPFNLSGTAVNNTDYSITASPVTIPAGEQQVLITIYLANDGINEAEESLTIKLGTPTNATVGPQDTHTITIKDPPQISFSTTSSLWAEDAGTKVITLQLSRTSIQNVYVDLNIGGTSTWGEYMDFTTGVIPVIIPSGNLTTSFVVKINDDYIDEETETISFTMTAPLNATIGANSTHLVTITDNDVFPDVSFYTDTHIVSEEVLTLTTSVYLTNISGKNVMVPFSIEYLTATADDIVLETPSPLVIPAGSKSANISFTILEGDGLEPDESFDIKIGQPTDAGLGSITSQRITIVEAVGNLPVISFSESGQTAIEGVDSSVLIGLEMDHAWKSEVTINFSVSGSAVGGPYQDYTITASPIRNSQGKIRDNIVINLNDDLISEGDETIIVTIDSIVNGTIGVVNQHIVTVSDNDSLPNVTFRENSQNVLETGGTVDVWVDASGLAENEIIIPLTISGTALWNSDYSTVSADIIIPVKSTSGYYQFNIHDDGLFDPGETIILSMGTPVNGLKGEITQHTITILDDELSPCDPRSVFITLGTDYLTWTLNNAGENIVLTGGEIIWPESTLGTGSPLLKSISFDGVAVFSGSEAPGTYSFTASETFPELISRDITYQLDSSFGTGDHKLSLDFANPVNGNTCSLNYTYNNP